MDKFVVRQKKGEVSSCGNQEKDEAVSSKSGKTTQRRKFRSEWKETFSWLEEKEDKAFCKVCEKFMVNHFTHLTSYSKKPTHIQLEQQKKNQLKLHSYVSGEQDNLSRQVSNAEQILVMFIVMHNLPFLLMDYLPNLLMACCPDSNIAKALKCGRTKSTQIVEKLGNKAVDQIMYAMRNSKFSLIIDETTDISTKKCLVLVVRYFDKISRAVNDRFLTLIELVYADAESIYKSIKSFFDTNKIPLNNLIGLATDGASTMAGELNGLKAKFAKDTPFFYLKCSCHSLHLCSSYACKKLPKGIETLCRNIYTFFSYSPKRTCELKEFQEYCNVPPHKILGLSLTRWLALENVINRILEQWAPLQLYFLSSVLEVNGIKAKDLAILMADEEVKVYFYFLSYILKIINDLNKEFQSEKVRLPFLYSQIEINFKLIACNYMDNEYVESIRNLADLDLYDTNKYLPSKNVYIGVKAESYLQSKNISEMEILKIKVAIREFYIEMLKQLKMRFDFNRQDLKDLTAIIPKNALCQTNNKILQLLNNFSYALSSDVETIVTEWNLLRLSKNDFKGELDLDSFWCNVSMSKNALNETAFYNLSNFIFNLMSLPHSSAAAERKFFELSLIKTKLRNKLEYHTINNIMRAKELCHALDAKHVWSP